jgi:TPR repeat protein
VQWYRLAADQGYPEAENNLGAMYDAGLGVAEDDVIAVLWFRRAATHKNIRAETNLGIMYAHGKGVAQDFAEARKWFQLAADRGDVKAQSNLGALYATGKGVPQSYEEAAKWYGRAASRGDATAGSILEKIRSAQARPETLSASPRTMTRVEPTVFRFSAPVMERRTVNIGPPPSFGGFHMGGHFGRR